MKAEATGLDPNLAWVIEHTNELAAFARQALAEGESVDAVLSAIGEAMLDSDHDRVSVFAACRLGLHDRNGSGAGEWRAEMSEQDVEQFLAEERRLDRDYAALLAGEPLPPRPVWVVTYGEEGPGPVSAIYDNEAAAREHVAFFDRMVLDGATDSVLRLERWSVQSEFRGKRLRAGEGL